ncbi:MAG: BamA/TamA family outer membrane protein [Planctomycetota bacterium]
MITLLILMAMPFCAAASRNDPAPKDKNADNPDQAAPRESQFVAAPMFVSNPAFGNGFGATGIYFYRPQPEDKISPSSAFSLLGLYSDTDSYLAGLFNRMFLYEDQWRIKMGLVTGRINHDLDVPDFGDVEFESNIEIAGGGIERRIFGNFFVGIDGAYRKISYKEGDAASAEYFELFGVRDNSSGTVAFPLSYDSRDNIRFPYYGTFAQIRPQFVPEWLGAEDAYEALEAQYNRYLQVEPRRILALRLYTRLTPTDTPYEGLSTLGRRSDLRGYTSGEYIGNNLISTQTEYRCLLTERFGVAGFGGLALLYDGSIKNVNSDSLFSSVGVGLRFVLHKETRQTFRIDYAWGEDDEDGLYVSIGEAF